MESSSGGAGGDGPPPDVTLRGFYGRHRETFWTYVRCRVRSDGDADDIVHDSMLELGERHGFDDRLPEHAEKELYTIVNGKLRTYGRERSRDKKREEPDSERMPASKDPEQVLDLARTEADKERKIQAALEQMSSEAVLIIELARKGMPHDEIAQIVGCKRGALDVRLHRARAELRKLVEASP